MTNNDIHVGDIVVTNKLVAYDHLNDRPMEVLEAGSTQFLCKVLIERPDDPDNTLGSGKRTRVRARKTHFRKL